MTRPTTTNQKLIEAEQMAGQWLYRGNRAAERGNAELAERHYARAQKWHDKMNRLLGNGDGSEAEPVRLSLDAACPQFAA
jgi:hypothetical protein